MGYLMRFKVKVIMQCSLFVFESNFSIYQSGRQGIFMPDSLCYRKQDYTQMSGPCPDSICSDIPLEECS